MSLSYDEIRSLSLRFRKAIEEVRDSSSFLKNRYGRPSLMTYFPNGCCEVSTVLFAYYLKQFYRVDTKQSNGVFRTNNPEDTTNHVWLTFCDTDIIVDLTYDQFFDFHRDHQSVYIGPIGSFHKSLVRVRQYENYDISKDEQLNYDYHEIIKRLSLEI